jgi:hypothetical protein
LRSKGVNNANIPHGELLREMIVKILGWLLPQTP